MNRAIFSVIGSALVTTMFSAFPGEWRQSGRDGTSLESLVSLRTLPGREALVEAEMALEVVVSRVFSFPALGAGSGDPDLERFHTGSNPGVDRFGYFESIYSVLADYRGGRPRILPERFFAELRILDGGWGEGTQFELRVKEFGGMRTIRAIVSEPVPGRVLIETDLLTGSEIRYELRDEGVNVRATIRARMEYGYDVPVGERLLAMLNLRRAFHAELKQLERVVRGFETGRREAGSGFAPGGSHRWGSVKRPPALSPSAVSRFVEAP